MSPASLSKGERVPPRRRRPSPGVTIWQVAELAGVSVTTVSHTLSGKRAVAAETRKRVLEVVDQLGYRPNAAASSLRTGLSNTMALIVPDVANPFFAELARGVEDAAHDRGWSVYLCNTALRPDREADYVDRCLAGGVDGIVYCSTQIDTDHVRRLRDDVADRLPVVICDERVEGMPGGVFSDNVAGGRLAGEHLVGLGRKRFVAIGGPHDLPTARDRIAGFADALERAGVRFGERRIRWTDYRMDAGFDAMRALLASHPKLDAVFAADDLLAIGAMQALQAADRRIPDDVAVCGFDDVSLASLVSPPLTSIRQRIHQLGAAAATMLLAHVLDDVDLDEIVLPVELIARRSTAG
jgi:LacI family transcriptional regulator